MTGAHFVEQFKAARGSDADADWAARAWLRLALAHVEAGGVDRSLGHALREVRESGMGPQELFGPADPWVDSQVAELSARGVSFTAPRTGPATAIIVGLFLMGLMYLLVFCIFLLGRGSHAPIGVSLLAAPLVISATAMTAIWLREDLERRMSSAMAGLAAVGVVGLGSGLTASMLFADGSARQAPTWWWLVASVTTLVVMVVLGRVLPDDSSQMLPTSELSDEQWFAELAGALRDRGDASPCRPRRWQSLRGVRESPGICP